MIKTERQKLLLDILYSNQMMSVSELSEELNSSMMTIRRDLDHLEQEGVIRKVHGGAVLIKSDNDQNSFQERIQENKVEKQKIGKEAAKLIKENSIVVFDSGTTSLAVADSIPEKLKFTAITTSLMTAVALCNKPDINIISIGGNIQNNIYSSINYLCVEMIKRFNADMAFITTKAFSFPEGTFEDSLPLIEVKQALVSISKKVILLADHSKFENKSLSLSIPINKIDTIVTDDKTSKKIIEQIRTINVEVIIT